MKVRRAYVGLFLEHDDGWRGCLMVVPSVYDFRGVDATTN